MGFVSPGLRIWPVTPCWTSSIGETLAWGTDVMLASGTAVSQHRSYRVGPRRSFTFEVLSAGQERAVVDMLLAGHRGVWQLPIWPDVQLLAAPVAAGATAVPCATAGFDFVAGGMALLYRAVNTWQVVSVESIAADHIALAAPLPAGFGPGDRLYPLRGARLQPGAEERMKSLHISRRKLVFDIAEPCDWPALASPTAYLGHPVMDVWPDETDDPASAYQRLLQTVNYEGALPFTYDLPDQALRTQSMHYQLFGRPQHTWLRSLLYTLEGRRVPMWLPSFAADMTAAAAVAGGSTTLSVHWCGYTQFGKGRHNRKDLRIELTDGTVLYRRITNAIEAGATETLTLSAALDAGSILPERIRAISFMALATLASDSVEIEHVTDQDGVANCTLGWQAVVPDV